MAKYRGVKSVRVRKRVDGWSWSGSDGKVRRGGRAYATRYNAVRGARRACGSRVQIEG